MHAQDQNNKMATLFSYFGKSPKTAATPGKKSNSSPSEQARQADGPKCDTSSTTGGTPVSSKTKSKLQSKASSKDSKQPKARDRTDRVCSSFQPGEIVWAKLEGHPSWPSMICAHPTTGRHVEDLGKSKQVHVQFFGEPPSRGWVSQR